MSRLLCRLQAIGPAFTMLYADLCFDVSSVFHNFSVLIAKEV